MSNSSLLAAADGYAVSDLISPLELRARALIEASRAGDDGHGVWVHRQIVRAAFTAKWSASLTFEGVAKIGGAVVGATPNDDALSAALRELCECGLLRTRYPAGLPKKLHYELAL